MGDVLIAEGIDQLEETAVLYSEIAGNTQTQVVDQPTIDQMDMRTSRSIHVGASFLEADHTHTCGPVDVRGDSRQ